MLTPIGFVLAVEQLRDGGLFAELLSNQLKPLLENQEPRQMLATMIEVAQTAAQLPQTINKAFGRPISDETKRSI